MSVFHGPVPEPSPRSRKAVLAHTARPAGAPKQPPENLPTVEPGDGTPLVLPPAWLLRGASCSDPRSPIAYAAGPAAVLSRQAVGSGDTPELLE